ncbi:MAG: PDZ domain-containing protein [Methylotenera sp.]|nr:PDZ domain-containing protein [Methylotenera sp.]
MRPNIHGFNHKTVAKLQILKFYPVSHLIWMSLLGLLAMLYVHQALAAENVTSQNNLYAEKYIAQNASQLKSLIHNSNTQLELGGIEDEDNTRMLENGYDLMGTSTFISTSTPDDLAKQHGNHIQADKVLVYHKNTALKTKITRLDGDKEGIEEAEKNNHDAEQNPRLIHYASYWAKLPMPLLGVHIIKLIPAENAGIPKADEVKGLTVIAVIKASPAAKANIAKGDNLLKIGEQALNKPDDLFAAVKQYAGQTVPVEVQRGQDVVKMRVALNARK